MPQVCLDITDYSRAIRVGPLFSEIDGSASQIGTKNWNKRRDEIYNKSTFWTNRARFAEARRRLRDTTSLRDGWDSYRAESPNDAARLLASKILNALEADSLPPSRLLPSAEGGISISLVERDNRAEIEIYNSGEIAVATYSATGEPVVWELSNTVSDLHSAISKIRVHLSV